MKNYYSEKYGYDENYGYGTSYYEFYVGGPVPEEVLRDQEKEIKSSSERKLREFWLENEECKKKTESNNGFWKKIFGETWETENF